MRAAAAYTKLFEAHKETFAKIEVALTKRFEPECKKEVYIAEFQLRQKKDWASFAEDMKTLVEKSIPRFD